ncbi:MAG TPA: metalloregulator ArsR/SmtB family transcription factor [Planctomycetaceae bacterium]|nr:metalloregulator ArsR/SmtB family transcription factor [Planctomycetaceae bacterium]
MDPPVAYLPVPADHEELADLCSMLAVPIRVRIVLLLASGERNVSELCNELKAPQPTISHHLGLLRAGRFVESRRAGKRVFYRLCDPAPERAGVTFEGANGRLRFTVGLAPSLQN